jgi:two-component system, chemotaxis family, protein-glutamate methylesterase/glutaminase
VNQEKIKVLIADDSLLVREILKDMISAEPDMEIVGEAQNGREAVTLTQRYSPHIITMDVLMPVMNGIEAVEEIMAFHPTPILVFSSAVNDKEMDVAFQSIARGALDVMEKPRMASGDGYEQVRVDLIHKLRMLSRIHVIPHLRGKRTRRQAQSESERKGESDINRNRQGASDVSRDRQGASDVSRDQPPAPARRAKTAPPPESVEPFLEPVSGLVELPPPQLIKRKLIAIGSSTGGPKALVLIFSRFPSNFPLPMLTVQHIAHSFAPGLVSWLDRESPLHVVLAADRMKPEPGTVYVSPTGVHLILEKGLLRLTDSPPVNSCKPSVDILFESVAKENAAAAVGVLLTGMGRDGAQGLKSIRNGRGRTIVQDQASSIIFGMPKAAIDLGAADDIVNLARIPEAIVKAAAT